MIPLGWVILPGSMFTHPNLFFQMVNKEVKKKDADLNFMVEGKTGKWRKWFTQELEKRFQEWESRWLEGCELKFEFDI